jgi:predicted PurR-regulated permease PerM
LNDATDAHRMPALPAQPVPGERERLVRVVRYSVIAALALLLLWLTVTIILVIFAGVLLGIFLRGLAVIVMRFTRLPAGLALAAVVLGIVVLLAALGWFFNGQIASQIDQLTQRLPAAISSVRHTVDGVPWLKHMLDQSTAGAIIGGGNGHAAARIFGIASSTFEVIAGLVVLVFIGLYTAAEPALYERAIVRLFPLRRRARAAAVLAELGDTLWYWMMGTLFSMAVIGSCTALGLWLIGVPLPIALGILAGFLTFIPYLGTITAGIITCLLALTVDVQHVLYVILLFVAIHTLEGYILVPLVQKRAARLAPALTLGAQAILGSILGILGVALATPVAAAGLVLVRCAYVEDTLGDDPDDGATMPATGAAAPKSADRRRPRSAR